MLRLHPSMPKSKVMFVIIRMNPGHNPALRAPQRMDKPTPPKYRISSFGRWNFRHMISEYLDSVARKSQRLFGFDELHLSRKN